VLVLGLSTDVYLTPLLTARGGRARVKSKRDSSGPTPRDSRHTSANPPSRTSQERAFNRWLNEQLRKKYDPVLDEAIPEEILELLRQDRDRQ
jgi:hypothetical protein